MKKSLAIAIMCCAFALTLGLVACGGSSSGSASASGSASGSASAASASSAASGDAKAQAQSDGYLDQYNLITAKALTELDGAKLTSLADSAEYKWDEKHAEWTKTGSDVAPMKGLTQEEHEAGGYDITDTSKYDFTQEEVAGFAVGAKGTPVEWMLSSKAKYNDVADVLAHQNVKVVEQCEVEHRNYGTQIWAIIENSAGDRFLMSASYYSNKGVVELFNSDYVATNSNGVASNFNLGNYLLEDKHTIDEAFDVIKSGEVS